MNPRPDLARHLASCLGWMNQFPAFEHGNESLDALHARFRSSGVVYPVENGIAIGAIELRKQAFCSGRSIERRLQIRGDGRRALRRVGGVPPAVCPGRFDLCQARGQHTAFLLRSASVETHRSGGGVQLFEMRKREGFWESAADIPELYAFKVTLKVTTTDGAQSFQMEFAEHDHGHGDAHTHKPRPLRARRCSSLGSSPMVEGIPTFFAASKYGPGVIAIMSLVFAASTILTYVLLCVYSTAGLKRTKFGALERYGEVLSGAFVALLGVVFWFFPVL